MNINVPMVESGIHIDVNASLDNLRQALESGNYKMIAKKVTKSSGNGRRGKRKPEVSPMLQKRIRECLPMFLLNFSGPFRLERAFHFVSSFLRDYSESMLFNLALVLDSYAGLKREEWTYARV